MYLCFNTLSPLIVGEQAGVTAACTAGFPAKKRRKTSHVNERRQPVSLISMTLEDVELCFDLSSQT